MFRAGVYIALGVVWLAAGRGIWYDVLGVALLVVGLETASRSAQRSRDGRSAPETSQSSFHDDGELPEGTVVTQLDDGTRVVRAVCDCGSDVLNPLDHAAICPIAVVSREFRGEDE